MNSILVHFWSVTERDRALQSVTDFETVGKMVNWSRQTVKLAPIASSHSVASIFTIFTHLGDNYGPPIFFQVSVTERYRSVT